MKSARKEARKIPGRGGSRLNKSAWPNSRSHAFAGCARPRRRIPSACGCNTGAVTRAVLLITAWVPTRCPAERRHQPVVSHVTSTDDNIDQQDAIHLCNREESESTVTREFFPTPSLAAGQTSVLYGASSGTAKAEIRGAVLFAVEPGDAKPMVSWRNAD